jgi:hypothetical protein
MHHTIAITYPSDAQAPLTLGYSMELVDDVHTISCSVDGKQFPIWLQLKKFQMSSLKQKNRYLPLFSEVNSSKNIDTSLFIDLVYNRIMQAENFKLVD